MTYERFLEILIMSELTSFTEIMLIITYLGEGEHKVRPYVRPYKVRLYIDP